MNEETMQTTLDLRAAAELLRCDGWTRDSLYDAETGRRCVGGALAVVTGGALTPRWRDSMTALGEYLGVFPSAISIYHWNDQPGRTSDDALSALEGAADLEESMDRHPAGKRRDW